MKFKKIDPKDGRLAEINIIPLVDIMLVLLIIFMVTAPMLKEGIDIELPEVAAKSIKSQQEDFIVSVDAQGSIYLDENKKEKFGIGSIVALEQKLREIFVERTKKELYLKADQGIKYGYIMQVMAACQRAGIDRIGMITVPPDELVHN